MGACAATALSAMRLPADAVLIVVDAAGVRSIRARPAPRARGRRATSRPSSPPGGPRVCRSPISAGIRPPRRHPPPDGEIVVAGDATSAFVGTALEARLDELGATTLVLCGALATHALEASARHAADLGYQVFVVADACWAVDAVDLNGRSGRPRTCGRWRWRA